LFNSKRIKHIAAVEILDECANLAECKIGLFQMINSSQRLSLQRIGRILRHKKPVLIFPYWMHTREEEIINELIKGYDSELIVRVSTVGNIKNYI
jgi:superfamily II DNA or RNA helicase